MFRTWRTNPRPSWCCVYSHIVPYCALRVRLCGAAVGRSKFEAHAMPRTVLIDSQSTLFVSQGNRPSFEELEAKSRSKYRRCFYRIWPCCPALSRSLQPLYYEQGPHFSLSLERANADVPGETTLSSAGSEHRLRLLAMRLSGHQTNQ